MSPRDRSDGAAAIAVAERERRARSRLWWATRPGLGLKATAVLLLGGLVLIAWLLLRPPPGQLQRPPAPSAAVSGAASPGGADAGAGPRRSEANPGAPGGVPGTEESRLIVHVAGAVAEPGLVDLAGGARIADAIEAAGGPTPEAVLGAVNLAAPARDGEQIYVPSEEESPPPSAGAAGAGGMGPGLDGAPVDLNTADAAALETLPGIGPVTAEKILSWRGEHGPFAAVSDLLAVPGIGPATLAQLEDRVRV